LTTATNVTADQLAVSGLANNKGQRIAFVTATKANADDVLVLPFGTTVLHADIKNTNGTADPVTSISNKNIQLSLDTGNIRAIVIYR